MDSDVISHPKTYALARIMGSDRPTALGVLISVWGYASRHHRDGDLTDAVLDALHDRTDWMLSGVRAEALRSARDDIRDALVEAGWADRTAAGRTVLHEWDLYQGQFLERLEADRVRQRRRRAQVADTSPDGSGSISGRVRARIYERDGWCCQYCERNLKTDRRAMTIDHVVPVSRGGSSRETNLVTACKACNYKKRHLLPLEVGFRWPPTIPSLSGTVGASPVRDSATVRNDTVRSTPLPPNHGREDARASTEPMPKGRVGGIREALRAQAEAGA